MSSKCSAAVFDRYPAGGGEFTLALALADNAHEDGTHIFPSVETMAQKSRQSVRAVQMHLRKMQDIGWLQLVKNGRGGRGRSAEYRINLAWLKGADIAPFSASAKPVDNFVKGAKLSMKRVQSDALKGAIQSSPYITILTPIEPNTPLTPQGGQPGGGDEGADSGAGSDTVDEGDPGAGFADFWAAWPQHDNKQGEAICLQRWRRKRLDRFASVIVADVLARHESPKWQKGFIEAPSKYLKESRWRDGQTNHAWHETKQGIEAMALRLGLEPWDEAEYNRTHEQSAMFHVYSARVRAEYDRRANGAN